MIPHHRRGATAAVAITLVLALSACFTGPMGPQTQVTGISTDQALVDASAPTTATVTMTDPVENSFWVDVPAGWDSVAYASGQFDVHREVVSSISPDGGTVLFLGDPKIPNYWAPEYATPVTVDMADALDFMELRSYTPAETFTPEWAQQKFSELPGFAINGVQSEPEIAAGIQQQFLAAGLQAPVVHAAQLSFQYDSERGPIRGLLIGITVDGGTFWNADIAGLATNRDPEDYLPMLTAMSRSKTTNPEWSQRSAELHAQQMAQIQANIDAMNAQHAANMAWIQQSAAAHQQRMEAIWASGDASMAAYYERMDAMDANQQQFINYINDEYTVATPSGQTFQVTDGYTNYYVNPSTGQYVGGDINLDDQQLIAMGLNPDDYQQVTIVR
jgi:hypothetical protein